MATLTVRNLRPDVYRALKLQAARNGRSMEAEARSILDQSFESTSDFISEWLADAEQLRGDDLEFPKRSRPRDVDLT